jgi:hypothetical protein
MREHYAGMDFHRQPAIEWTVSEYIRQHFSFAVVRIDQRAARLSLESKMISTVSLCNKCLPSAPWLGLYSPKEKIRESGLWLVNELYKEPLAERDLERLSSETANGSD